MPQNTFGLGNGLVPSLGFDWRYVSNGSCNGLRPIREQAFTRIDYDKDQHERYMT